MVELRALAAANPSGIPSARQKREARYVTRERLDQEASDGRFLRRKAYPILWDGQANELLVGTTSSTTLDRIHILFQKTFNRRIELNGAGGHAYRPAEQREQTRSVEAAAPAIFVPGEKFDTLAWLPHENSCDFLGNEFLLWLWYVLDDESDVIKAADGSEITVQLARSLVLEYPRGQTGRESIRSEWPVALPEHVAPFRPASSHDKPAWASCVTIMNMS